MKAQTYSKKKPLVTFIFGTRPEAIKMAPVILKFRASKNIRTRVILTGQHRDLVKEILDIFEINYDLNIEIMSKSQSLSSITTNILNKLKNEFSLNKPNLVLVQGDTSTAFAAALSAFYEKIKVGHIEAGLRTNNLLNPFPEEANRRLISQISTLHFAPTKRAKDNLEYTNISGQIFLTGNTVIDALDIIRKKNSKIEFSNFEFKNKKLILATVHRRENWGENLRKIALGFLKIIEEHPNTILYLPVHPNPEVKNLLFKILGNKKRILLKKPLPYDQLVSLIDKAEFVLTDSGGLQEEAPSFQKPILILRDTTERPEVIEAGSAKLVGTESENIYKEATKLLLDKNFYNRMANNKNPFGDGQASLRILKYSEKMIFSN